MAKVLCVLYDDPINGYPKSYARDGIPRVERYPGGQTVPAPKHIDFNPGELLGSVSGELGLRKFLEGLGHTLVVTSDKEGATSAFERDLRRMKRQRKDLDKIEAIVDALRQDAVLPPRCRVHPLRGEWEGHSDCHIEPDWVLIYKIAPGALTLVRTGSHSELFR